MILREGCEIIGGLRICVTGLRGAPPGRKVRVASREEEVYPCTLARQVNVFDAQDHRASHCALQRSAGLAASTSSGNQKLFRPSSNQPTGPSEEVGRTSSGGSLGSGFSSVAEKAYSDVAKVLRLLHTFFAGVRDSMLIFKEYDGIYG
jgi:hypothetical protein